MTSVKFTPLHRFGFRGSILYWPQEGLNPLVCLTGSAPSHIPPAPRLALKCHDCQGPSRPPRDGLKSPAFQPVSMATSSETEPPRGTSRGDVMAKSKFRPLHDRVVVKRIDAEEKTKGGIIIPDSAKEKPSQGEITAVGPGGRDEAGKLIPIDLKVGDRVLFGKWSGTEVKLDGEELLIMKESDIMGVLTDVPAAKKKAA